MGEKCIIMAKVGYIFVLWNILKNWFLLKVDFSYNDR